MDILNIIRKAFFIAAAASITLVAGDASAACVNKFVGRADAPRQVITFLTGRLTFQEAQALSAAISAREAPLLEWVDAKGKTIAKQFGELKVLRPMPVGCDDRKSGVVLSVTFMSVNQPKAKMSVKLNDQTTIEFEEQVQ